MEEGVREDVMVVTKVVAMVAGAMVACKVVRSVDEPAATRAGMRVACLEEALTATRVGLRAVRVGGMRASVTMVAGRAVVRAVEEMVVILEVAEVALVMLAVLEGAEVVLVM